MSLSSSPLADLAGTRFPGGTRTIENWESHLLTDCTGADPLPDDQAHPVGAFILSVLGAGPGTTIAELFALCGVAEPGSVWLESYDWVYDRQLRHGVPYAVSGGIDAIEEGVNSAGRPFDRVVFSYDMHEPGCDRAVGVTTTWRIGR